MIIGLDATNLGSGGARTHLVQLMQHADPVRDRFSMIRVFASRAVLDLLPVRSWLDRVSVDTAARAWRPRWLLRVGSTGGRGSLRCDVWFAPGGIALGGSVPRVVMCRNMLPYEPRELARYPIAARARFTLLARVQIASMRRAHSVIFLSGYAADKLSGRIGRRPRRIMIPHGVSNAFREVPPWNPPADGEAFRWAYVSQIDRYKHHSMLLGAFRQLRASGENATLECVGCQPGSERDELAATAAGEPMLRGVVTLRGPVSASEIVSVLGRAHGIVYPSTCENLPNALLEAMAAGRPVIAASVGPMPEIVGDAGILVAPESPDALAEAMRLMMREPEMADRLATAARQRVHLLQWERAAIATFQAVVDATH